MKVPVAARLLKSLGNSPQNSVKYFAALELLELAKDRTWLAKMTNAVSQHWQHKKPLMVGNGHSPQISLQV